MTANSTEADTELGAWRQSERGGGGGGVEVGEVCREGGGEGQEEIWVGRQTEADKIWRNRQ